MPRKEEQRGSESQVAIIALSTFILTFYKHSVSAILSCLVIKMNIPRSVIIQQKSLVVMDYFIPEEHISTQMSIFFGILCICVPQMSLSKSIIFFKENKSQKASVSLKSLLDEWKSLSKVWQSWFYLAFDFYDFKVFLFGFTWFWGRQLDANYKMKCAEYGKHTLHFCRWKLSANTSKHSSIYCSAEGSGTFIPAV